MSKSEDPINIELIRDDFEICGWRDCLSKDTENNYFSMWQHFSSGAKKAEEENNQKNRKILSSLADACLMKLDPSNKSEPFVPIMRGVNDSPVCLDIFSDDDITFFSNIVDIIDNNLLKARLSDIVWSRNRSLGIQYALEAIDAYRSIPLNTDSWFSDGHDCWERALSLALMLRKPANTRLNEIKESLLCAFRNATTQERFFPIQIYELIKKYRIHNDNIEEIANKLESMANDFYNDKDFYAAGVYYSNAVELFKVLDDSKWVDLVIKKADCFLEEADMRVSIDKPSYIAATEFCKDALLVYRTIPKDKRELYGVDEKTSEIHKKINEYGKQMSNEMVTIDVGHVDITESVKHNEDKIKGKTALDALLIFANICGRIKYKNILEEAAQHLQNHPLQAMFSKNIIDSDGRVVARNPGMGEDSDSQQVAVYQQAMEQYAIMITFYVEASILPALNILHIEHCFRESDFIALAQQSAIIPQERARLFGKGLFAGYNYDFITATHILVPQVEHMVRYHLKNTEEKTTTLDKIGVETENGLNTLMNSPLVNDIFGEDLTFEIKSIYCEPSGPNLRNSLAHGLISEDACYSVAAIYSWWLILKITFNTYWNILHSKDAESNNKDTDQKNGK